MIDGAFHHLPGIGPRRARDLEAAGMRCWSDVERDPDCLRLGAKRREALLASIRATREAWEQQDVRTLVATLATRDHWRILAHYFERASFFDIETSGQEVDAVVTLISCLHRGRLHTFLRGENLDDFLDLLDEVDLLISFNGNSFDVPRVERTYHIPSIPCAHLDLRWVCYHEGLRGGLKSIERQLGVERPEDLAGVDGEEAVWLWQRWEHSRDAWARERLLRYCGADSLTLSLVASTLLRARGCEVCGLSANWSALLPRSDAPAPIAVARPTVHDARSPGVDDTRVRLLRHLRRTRGGGRMD